MRGKQARRLRQAARLLVGPDAPALRYTGVRRGIAGVELRHDESSLRGMYRKLKRNYLRVLRKEGRAVRVLELVKERNP